MIPAIDHTIVPKVRPEKSEWMGHFNSKPGKKKPLPEYSNEVFTKRYLRDGVDESAYMDDPKEDHND